MLDDTNIFVTCDSLKDGQKHTNEILDKLSDFMLCSLLHFNLDKSCYMHFPSSRKSINHKNVQVTPNSHALQNEINLFIGGNQIKEVTDTKFPWDPIRSYAHLEAHILKHFVKSW